jgi:hypothetical protein
MTDVYDEDELEDHELNAAILDDFSAKIDPLLTKAVEACQSEFDRGAITTRDRDELRDAVRELVCKFNTAEVAAVFLVVHELATRGGIDVDEVRRVVNENVNNPA